MKLFTCQRSGNYSGGCICVAAFTMEEAYAVAIRELRKTNKDYIADNMESYYPLCNWEEVKNIKVTSKDLKTILICEDGYTE